MPRRYWRCRPQPGNFFTVVQIGLQYRRHPWGHLGVRPESGHQGVHLEFYQGPWLGEISSAASFVFVTGMFIRSRISCPKRLAMTMPGADRRGGGAPHAVGVTLLMPLVWLFNGSIASGLFRLLRISMVRNDGSPRTTSMR